LHLSPGTIPAVEQEGQELLRKSLESITQEVAERLSEGRAIGSGQTERNGGALCRPLPDLGKKYGAQAKGTTKM